MNTSKKMKEIRPILEKMQSIDSQKTDEGNAKAALLEFYEELRKVLPDKALEFNTLNEYYSFYYSMIPMMLALRDKQYRLACHELITLEFNEDIMQKRVYSGLMYLYRQYLE